MDARINKLIDDIDPSDPEAAPGNEDACQCSNHYESCLLERCGNRLFCEACIERC